MVLAYSKAWHLARPRSTRTRELWAATGGNILLDYALLCLPHVRARQPRPLHPIFGTSRLARMATQGPKPGKDFLELGVLKLGSSVHGMSWHVNFTQKATQPKVVGTNIKQKSADTSEAHQLAIT